MNCQHDCQKCQSNCTVLSEEMCPICHKRGFSVPPTTVLVLTDATVNTEKIYYLCTHPKCPVGYYVDGQVVAKAKDVKAPIWYKGDYEHYTVCYCRNILLDDIVKAVEALNGSTDKQEILSYLKKINKPEDCLHQNPTGQSCEVLFDHAIEYAYQKYIKKPQC